MTSLAAPAPLVLPEVWHPQLALRPRPCVDWVWPGYLARGAVTLLTSQWPKGAGRPNPAILEACLARAVTEGRLKQEGSGQRRDPVRYFIDGLDATWTPDITELLGY
jgi:hypothetical protein